MTTITPALWPLLQSMLIAFASAVALVPVARRLAIRIDVVARPRADRWHRTVVPLLGGVAIGLATFIAGLAGGLAVSLPAVLFASMAMFVIGLVDDILALRPATKLVGQIAKRQAVTNPANTLFAVKRMIGRKRESEEVKRFAEVAPFPITDVMCGYSTPDGHSWSLTVSSPTMTV